MKPYLVSPTSYNAFVYLQKNDTALTDLGVEVEYVMPCI